MERIEKDYAAFEKAMDEDGLYREIPDFPGICLKIGAEPDPLDRKVYEELGLRGQALVEFYRNCENLR